MALIFNKEGDMWWLYDGRAVIQPPHTTIALRKLYRDNLKPCIIFKNKKGRIE
jgi:hypothetical protein